MQIKTQTLKYQFTKLKNEMLNQLQYHQMKRGDIVWCKLESKGWWPAQFSTRVECIDQQKIFYLNQVQPFGGIPLSFMRDNQILPYNNVPDVHRNLHFSNIKAQADQVHQKRIQKRNKMHVKKLNTVKQNQVEEIDKELKEYSQTKTPEEPLANTQIGVKGNQQTKKQFLTFQRKKQVLMSLYYVIRENYPHSNRDEAQNAALAVEKEVYERSKGINSYENYIKKMKQRLQNKELFQPVQTCLNKEIKMQIQSPKL